MKKVIKWFKELKKRFTLPTPEFWGSLRNFSLFVTGLLGAGIIMPGMPEWAVTIQQHAIGIFFFISVISQLAVYDNDLQSDN